MSPDSGPPRRPGVKLGVEQVDLLFLHQTLPSQFEKTLQACLALETLLADGTVRAIGIPKSTRPERIAENIDVFEVKLTDDELAAIDGLDTGQAFPAGGAGARVPGAERKSPDGGVHLNRLRGSTGNQNYPVPTTVGLQRPFTVLIWCRAFAVPIAAATAR